MAARPRGRATRGESCPVEPTPAGDGEAERALREGPPAEDAHLGHGCKDVVSKSSGSGAGLGLA